MSESSEPLEVTAEPELRSPGEVPYRFVQKPDELEQLVGELAGAGRVAVDTEADSLHCYREKLCLIQLSYEVSGGVSHVLVDPLALPDVRPLIRALEEKQVLMHGSSYDLKMLQVDGPFQPKELIDTEWAAKLLGCKQFGLANLVAAELGIGLSKQHQKADWGRRPLPVSMQGYAVNDTRFLLELVDRLLKRLEALGRLAWLESCCARMLEGATRRSERDEDEEKWRISGSGRLRSPQLEVLRRLWHWRNQVAERLDRPPFRVAGNELLLDVAAQGEAAPVFTGQRRFPPRWLHDLRQVVREAASVPEAECPLRIRGKRGPSIPDWEAKFERLRKIRDKTAETLGVESGVIAPRKSLERLAAGEPPEAHLMDWQTAVLTEQGATFGG